jgi:hypothetical protein
MAKQTHRRRRRSTRRSSSPPWWIIGIVVTLVIVGGAIVYVTSNNQGKDLGERIADLGNAHLVSAPQDYLWNSRPPTSGPHAPQLAAWGEHTETVPEWYQVHNLEDGGVILHYNCPEGCPETVNELRAIVNQVGDERLILQPYTNMDSRIAATAWTRLLTLDEVDQGKIVDFIKAYRGIDHHR